MPQPFVSLGTDGFGLSDTRPALRRHFEIDAAHIVVAVLSGLSWQGEVKADTVIDAARQYHGIDVDLPDPRLLTTLRKSSESDNVGASGPHGCVAIKQGEMTDVRHDVSPNHT